MNESQSLTVSDLFIKLSYHKLFTVFCSKLKTFLNNQDF